MDNVKLTLDVPQEDELGVNVTSSCRCDATLLTEFDVSR